MTVREAAKLLELHPSSVYDLIATGQLPCRRVGPKRGKIVVDQADVDTYWRKAKIAGGVAPKAPAAAESFKFIRPPA